jgi:DNA gyrase subunit A
VLLEDSGVSVTAAEPLEIPDGPARVLLSATGLLARIDADTSTPLPDTGPRANHDVITSEIITRTHGEFGVITATGQLIKTRVIDLPNIPLTANAPNLKGGVRARELLGLDKKDRILAVVALEPDSPGLALGTRNGVVKRVNPEILSKESWDVIRLDDGDELVGAVQLADDTQELVFITSDAQLLHFAAANVRPQGRSGGGMAGIKLSKEAHAIWFGATPAEDAVVVTISGSSTALPGTQSGMIKITGFEEFPGKGRATGGVRCHRFLKGEDTLILGWAGPRPEVACSASGTAIDLPSAAINRRDGSGSPAPQPVFAVASRKLA